MSKYQNIESINTALPKLLQTTPAGADLWEDEHEQMQVHLCGKNAGEFLTSRRPNEDKDVMDYRTKIFEYITLNVFQRAVNSNGKIFQSSNYSWKVSDRTDAIIKQMKFNGTSFENYIFNDVLQFDYEDANGYLVWLPSGQGIYDAKQKVTPTPELVYSSQVIYIDDEYFIWQNEKDTYCTITKDGYYKHVKIIKDKKEKYELYPIYPHKFGFIPAFELKGIAAKEEIEKNVYIQYYKSFFSHALSVANECCRQFSDWQAIMVQNGFPFRVEDGSPCDHPGCMNGIVSDKSGEAKCPKCLGTGVAPIARSPYGRYLRVKNSLVSGEQQTAEPVSFVSPNVDIIDNSYKSWIELRKQTEEALYLYNIDEAQSGEAKAIDRDEQYAFLTKISDNLFDNILYNSLLCIDRYLFIGSKDVPTIIKPTNFVIKTEGDLIDEYGTLNTNKLPVSFRNLTLKDLSKKRFINDANNQKAIEFLMVYDILFSESSDEVNMIKASGCLPNEVFIRHFYAYSELAKIMDAKKQDFANMTYDSIKALMETAMQQYYDAVKPKEVYTPENTGTEEGNKTEIT